MLKQHAQLIEAMTAYDHGDPLRIQHFIKVYGLASVIGTLEGLDEETLFILETAAIVHDIGIHPAEAKYGSSAGNYQEIEGPPEAEKLLREMGGYTDAQIERVKYLVGHHHTYTNIDGIDYQILIEADFLVNLYENQSRYASILTAGNRIFKTETGQKLLKDMFKEEY